MSRLSPSIPTGGLLADTIAQRRETGLPVGSTAGALSEERRDALEAIDPSWCPSWPVVWQRSYRLCRRLIEDGRPLPVVPGEVSVQGEDLGAWVQPQRLGWDALLPAQAWMLENMLHLGPADPSARPQAPRTQADKWAVNFSGGAAVPRPRGEPPGAPQARGAAH
ncbi:hypothetical protein PV350_41730 [Streptomyces sp. PA03-6a]|nr:hypothetical protein [Streptomyces sp. PA03-6a]